MALATKLLARKRVVTYLPNLNSAVKYVRSFSISSGNNKRDEDEFFPDEFAQDLGPFGPLNKRLPLPGSIGPKFENKPYRVVTKSSAKANLVKPFLENQPEYRHCEVLDQLALFQEEDGFMTEDSHIPHPSDRLEYVAQECPQIMKLDFKTLFPGRDIMNGTLTLVTISQKTDNDMTAWNTDVDEEREALLAAFVQGAKEICEVLESGGYWADFIDPSCGKPFLGPHTNATLFETDEVYRKLGFEIEDLGCCKVIRHHLWGTKCYVGCLFTNAPLSHPIIEMMTDS
ncbi:methylmalonic aciduria and homocystinuria type D homolog, mitochondrial-like [Mizuhopecten yessoensis]|uniref:Methylmalonic aciduria and homocystinuria type D-like n=1 Tax=Mizuhopecten yessoensis TaxID=6573 RepID=A0A210PU30_MIZYE|nr:methylmalonic aciduria and homocystinuria type D homolog, mitochondrial-like [Mizuhopecten yessoensis]OWF39993.1 Methylmalonic aciduria and homocystinuria type D-like [Mizuhopecten yessoensis]